MPSRIRNRESYQSFKARRATCDLPQIPDDCHTALVKHGSLSNEQEARADAAIRAACARIHERRGPELERRSGERVEASVREFSVVQGIVRSVA